MLPDEIDEVRDNPNVREYLLNDYRVLIQRTQPYSLWIISVPGVKLPDKYQGSYTDIEYALAHIGAYINSLPVRKKGK